MVMPDGTLGESPFRVIDNFVYSKNAFVVVLGKDASESELRAIVAEGTAAIIGIDETDDSNALASGTDIRSGRGLYGRSGNGVGVYGTSAKGGIGVEGYSSGDGVYGYSSSNGNGVEGTSSKGTGVRGSTLATDSAGVVGYASLGTSTGVQGWTDASGDGVTGYSNSGYGVRGETGAKCGIYTSAAINAGSGNVPIPNGNQQGAGWIDCPETGECACPNGQYVTKTADRGARNFCTTL
jgi:hypothetical protein